MGRAKWVAGGLVLLAVLGACGGGEGGNTDRAGGSQAEARAAEECGEAMADLIDALKELDSRLDVGLAFQEYGSEVGDIKVEYDDVEFDELSEECIEEVGVPLEDALNAYIKAYNKWNDCIGDTYCDIDDVDLQTPWQKASESIDDAEEDLEELGG